jgi:hypothetical protein
VGIWQQLATTIAMPLLLGGGELFSPLLLNFWQQKKEVRKEGVNTQLTSSFLSKRRTINNLKKKRKIKGLGGGKSLELHRHHQQVHSNLGKTTY